MAIIGQMLGIDTIKITQSLLKRICDIDEFKGLWNGLDDHTTGLNMLREVADHGSSLHHVLNSLQSHALSSDIIKKIHQAQTGSKEAVPYKTQDNQVTFVGADNIPAGFIDTAPPEQVQAFTDKLTKWLNDELSKQELHPLIIICVFTGVFFQIAPFETENKKTALFIILLLMMKTDYAYAPYVPLDKLFTEHASEVYRALKHNQASLEAGRPDWSVWLDTFFKILQAQKNILQKRLLEKDKDLSHLPTLSARILALFEDHERLQMKEIINLTRGRRSTIKLRIGELVDQGYLKRHGQARNTWYALN